MSRAYLLVVSHVVDVDDGFAGVVADVGDAEELDADEFLEARLVGLEAVVQDVLEVVEVAALAGVGHADQSR